MGADTEGGYLGADTLPPREKEKRGGRRERKREKLGDNRGKRDDDHVRMGPITCDEASESPWPREAAPGSLWITRTPLQLRR